MTVRNGFIVDTSVAMKWLVDEEDSETALALRHQDLVAPALMRIEAGNVLRTLAARQAISNAEAQKLFAFLQTAPVVIVDPDDKLEKHALELALELGQPIYDCVFLALAHRTSRTLVTADGRFIRALAGSDHAGSAASLEDLPELIVAQR